MSDRRTLLAATLALVLAATAGCGAAADQDAELSGEPARVAQAINDLEEAAREGEERRICRQLLSAALARQAGDCTRTVGAAIDESDLWALTVERVDVRGDRATAVVTSGGDDEQRETLQLVRENRSWRLNGFGAG